MLSARRDRRLLWWCLIAVGALGCAPAPVLSRPAEFHRGVALGLFAPDARAAADLERLAEIRSLGATHVSLVISWAQQDVSASRVEERPGYTVPREALAALVRHAHRLGLRVMLFPIVRLVERTPSEWRGVIAPADERAWFVSYGTLVNELARLAEAEGVAVLSIGSELVSLEPRVAAWRGLVDDVRRRYHGQILYSANWDRYHAVQLWPHVDLIGISAYWDLTPPGRRPTEDEIVRAWRPIHDAVTQFARAVGKPLVFTEFGYPSVAGGGGAPWNHVLDGAAGVVDLEAQRRLYEGFARVWGDEPSLHGAYAWMWFGAGGFGDRTYTPRGKPAEQVLRTWYRDRRVLPPPR